MGEVSRPGVSRGLTGSVKSADRVLDLFELLGDWNREMSHGEIANRLSIPKSSLTPLLRVLVARSYIEYHHVTKGYRLGRAFERLAQRSSERRSLADIVHPVLEAMTLATGESSIMNQVSGDDGETTDAVTGPHRLVSHMRVGDMGPLYALSGGKAILARMPTEMVEDYLARVQFEQITPSTIRSADQLRRELDGVRRLGFATSIEEFTLGIAGIGMPILAPDGFPVAAISVVLPVVRLDQAATDTAVSALHVAVKAITDRLADQAA